ncbi:MAG: hypothetical protein ABJF88_05700 [Rhodothermales bacterium]
MSASATPSPVRLLLASAPAVGFSGSRSASPVCLAACRAVLPLVGGAVHVGCAPGLDAAVRSACPSASVLSAVSFGGAGGFGRGAFAARSVALVRAVAAAGQGAVPPSVWVSFPGCACPAGLAPCPSPSRCFSGLGSGSWASLAFAAGLGLPCLVFVPPGVPAPAPWGFTPLGGGWLFRPAPPSLFTPA